MLQYYSLSIFQRVALFFILFPKLLYYKDKTYSNLQKIIIII